MGEKQAKDAMTLEVPGARDTRVALMSMQPGSSKSSRKEAAERHE